MNSLKNNKSKKFSRHIGEMEKRKLESRQEKKRSEWQGFGLFGTVGWSVVVPTLLGTALGKWLDLNYPESFSWTLSLLIVGLLIGCVIAAFWIRKEHRDMHRDKENEDE